MVLRLNRKVSETVVIADKIRVTVLATRKSREVDFVVTSPDDIWINGKKIAKINQPVKFKNSRFLMRIKRSIMRLLKPHDEKKDN